MKIKKQKNSGIRRFLIIAAVVLVYACFAVYKFGLQNGLAVTGLTWSLFIFATPIADAGFLVGFPLRLLLGIRMFHSQIGVWIVGLIMNIAALSINPAIYDKTTLLRIFHQILTTPWPLWSILIISTIGTFVSIRFEDDAIDIASSIHKKKLLVQRRRSSLVNIGVLAATIVLYVFILSTNNINIAWI